MAGGLVALLDDVAALAKLAAASVDDVGAAAGRASAKAAGVVVDDTAVTPRYVSGFTAERELPMIRRIAVGSLRNKVLFILPALLVMSQFVPWILTPLLMAGGTFLCFEGAEKIWEKISPHHEDPEVPVAAREDERAGDREEEMVSSAIRTDFILSSEIMVISLNEVADEPLIPRALTLLVVAILITVMVYGVVALIVKADDVGLYLSRRGSGFSRSLGLGLVKGMPSFMKLLSNVGIAAMLWVGGHILLLGTHELGWDGVYDTVHHLEEAAREAVPSIGGLLGWLVNTGFSAIIGLVVGAVVVAIVNRFHRSGGAHGAEAAAH